MQDSTPNRKRPAPGTSPAVPQQNMQQQNYPFQPLAENTDFSNFDFSQSLPAADQQPFADPSNTFDSNNFNYALNNSQQPMYGANYAAPANTSTDLVRRSRDQQLAAPQDNTSQDQWNGFNAMNAQTKPEEDDEDEQDLDLKVALAKKDAQGKRRNILPFVQKLSSFLDNNNNNNTDLIRWSDDGRSFIVLDEDEFARTLIPEVFKHNNYASFVRQLNMYGFHKTVNITDGSLRQSEKARKGVKPPSMYSHPYFRRNRPDLLWLVQKPAGGNKATKRKRESGYDSDEDRQYPTGPDSQSHQLSAPNTSQDLAQLPRNELAAVRRELQNLQTQQKYISQMITQLKEQNDTFYRQASTFQALHDRHENSINAILTFLATFYRQGLEGHGAQNLVNMFTNMPTQNQQHGSVVEEYNDSTPTLTNQVQRFVKRPPLLLPGPAAAAASPQTQASSATLQPGSAVTEPSSARASETPPNESAKRGSSAAPDSAVQPQSATTPAVKNEVQTPNNDQMMDLINNANATTQASTPGSTAGQPTAIDMNSIVDRMNQNNSPLTAQQREDMVNSVLGTTSSSNQQNALTPFKAATDPAQWKEKLDQSHNALDYLQQLQKQQDAKVQQLNRRLQPLSPTGTIPGLHDFDANQDPFDALGAPGDYDPSAFINFDDPQPWETADGNGDFDFDFDPDGDPWEGFDGVGGDAGGGDGNDMFAAAPLDGAAAGDSTAAQPDAGQVESVAGSEETSPAAVAAAGNDEAGESASAAEAERPAKRTRRS